MTITNRIATAQADDVEHIARYSIGREPLNLDAATLTMDESYAPYAMLRMRSTAPDSQELLDRLDPRKPVRIDVTMGYRFADGEEETDPIASLNLDDRTIERPANTMQLVAQGDERLVLDRGTTSTLTFTPADEAFTSIVRIIRSAIPNAQTRDDGTRIYGWVPADDPVTVDPGDNAISAIVDVADRIGDLWVYADAMGVWRITRRPTLAEAPFLTLKVGERGTILKSTSKLGRSDWANTLLLIHRWRDGDQDREIRSEASVMTGTYRPSEVGRKLQVVQRTTPIDQYTATVSAASLLRRAASRGRSLTIEAIADYRLRPGHTIAVQLPLGPEELHLVAAVHFEQPAGVMTVETRLPDNAEISNGA